MNAAASPPARAVELQREQHKPEHLEIIVVLKLDRPWIDLLRAGVKSVLVSLLVAAVLDFDREMLRQRHPAAGRICYCTRYLRADLVYRLGRVEIDGRIAYALLDRQGMDVGDNRRRIIAQPLVA